MRIDALLIVAAEWIAFITWAIHFKKISIIKYRLFTIYTGLIAVTELLNLLLTKEADGVFNKITIVFNIPLQFIFLFYYLLYQQKIIFKNIFFLFSTIYLILYMVEQNSTTINKINFDSLSYGAGNILLIAAIIISIVNFFKTDNVINFYRLSFFWILCGITLYYIGSFPYQNFRNFFWSDANQYNRAYVLHYTSQYLDCFMYLLFAYAALCKKI